MVWDIANKIIGYLVGFFLFIGRPAIAQGSVVWPLRSAGDQSRSGSTFWGLLPRQTPPATAPCNV
jgi:hypothetical protein